MQQKKSLIILLITLQKKIKKIFASLTSKFRN